MRIKLIGTFILILFLLFGYKYSQKSQVPPNSKFSQLQSEQKVFANDIVLISIKTPIKLGDSAYLTIRGKSGQKYTATANFKFKDKPMTVKSSKIAGSDGLVTWTWNVHPNTVPGTYPITVSGRNSEYTTVYTVID